MFERSFSKEDLGKVAYILGIKIYRDISRRLIGLSQSTCLDKDMDQSKKGFLPVLQGVKLSKTQSSTTAEERERMKVIPYASRIGSIMYAMLCTRPDVCLAIVWQGGTKVIQESLQESGTLPPAMADGKGTHGGRQRPLLSAS